MPFTPALWYKNLKSSFEMLLAQTQIVWHGSPAGTPPLSCGQGQCWCSSPKIHRGRFHQPERKLTACVSDLNDKGHRVLLMKVACDIKLNTQRPIIQSWTWWFLRQNFNTKTVCRNKITLDSKSWKLCEKDLRLTVTER